MAANVKQHGNYELFETTNGHRILVLEGKDWYAWVEGQESPLLVQSDSDHDKDHTLSEGRFYLIDFEGDHDFRDQPHLFLQENDRYRALIVPNGLPTQRDKQKRLIEVDEKVDADTLKRHID